MPTTSPLRSSSILYRASTLVIFCFFNCFEAIAQGPPIQWAHCYGGTDYEFAKAMDTAADGGYIIAGTSYSDDGDVNIAVGARPIWIVKLSHNGLLQWQRRLGGLVFHDGDIIYSIHPCRGGGYVAAGSATSNDGDVSGNHGSQDAWVVKLNDTGVVVWQRCYGGSRGDVFYTIRETTDGGFVASGISESVDGDATNNYGDLDFWVVKLDGAGNIQWQKNLGGSFSDQGHDIQQTRDGGYVVTGVTDSDDSDVIRSAGTRSSDPDYWIVKLSAIGSIEWQKCYGSNYGDVATSVQQSLDGGYVVLGGVSAGDKDVTGFHGGDGDLWVVKLDSIGNLQWQKCLGGRADEFIDAYISPTIRRTFDSGFIVTGFTNSKDGDITDTSNDGYNAWLVKLSATGNIVWQKCYGGLLSDVGIAGLQTSDSGYFFVGHTHSTNDIGVGSHGLSDIVAVKLGPYPNEVGTVSKNSLKIYPTVTSGVLHVDFPVHLEPAAIRAYNLVGQMIGLDISGDISKTILIKDAKPGVYILQVATASEVMNYKFIYQP